MKRFGIALAAGFGVFFAASSAVAQTPATPVTPAPTGPVVTAAGPTDVVVAAPTTQTRRGLFGRLRNRGTTTTTPVMAPMTPAPAPMFTPGAPQPMPGTTRTNGETVINPQPIPAGPIMPAGGTIVSPDGTMMTAGYSEPTQTRRGLLARLRARR